ncbi:MAG: tetratricopeptide repeat protein [Steroidobacteraceae bacterium]|nr:tetratricopeptide repeat protein [Steroidobacteraceae bacterium]
MGRRLIRCIALACTFVPAAAFSESAAVLADAERLIRDGRGAEAWRLLARHEAAYAGSALYDYLYGVAALDAGQPQAASRALERVVANDPRSAAARLELGRAYRAAGERTAAERQFREALALDPPPAVRSSAEAWLRSTQAPAAAAAGGLRGGYEFGAGFDSNANASTEDETFLGITLDPTSVEQSSAFMTGAGWFGHSAGLGGGRLETSGRLSHRWNPDADWVDQTIASLGTQLRFGDGPTVFGVGLGGWYGLLHGDPHHWSLNLDLSLSHGFGDGWRATGMLRGGQLRYETGEFPGLSIRDVDQFMAAVALQRADDEGHFGVTLFHGSDDARESASPFGNERLGLQLYGGKRSAAGHDVGMLFAWQDVDFDGTPGFFGGMDRSDTHWSAAFTVGIRDWPARGFTLVPRVGWTVNRSNVALYEYHRFEAGLTLTRPFRQ